MAEKRPADGPEGAPHPKRGPGGPGRLCTSVVEAPSSCSPLYLKDCRLFFPFFGPGPIAFKLLIDNHEAGYVIGTKGATIDSIQASSGASIRISHSSDFFPGSQKRTCMIQVNAFFKETQI